MAKLPKGRAYVRKIQSFNTNYLVQQQRRNAKVTAERIEKKKTRYKNFIGSIGKLISGKKQLRYNYEKKIYYAFWGAVIHSFFISLYEAYKAKSEHGYDDLGNDWPDHSIYTKAYVKDKRGRLTRNQRTKFNYDTPGLLSPAQYRLWKKNFAKHFRDSMFKGPRKPSLTQVRKYKEAAGKYAWFIAKQKGAETLKDVMAKETFPLMFDTGTLMKSFKPGLLRKTSGPTLGYRPGDINQVVRLNGGEAEIGTSVPYSKLAEHNGKRPLFPKSMGLWYDRALEAGTKAVTEELKKINPNVIDRASS